MKKILLCVPLLALAVAGLVGCSQQRKWTHEQRKAMREALRDYRQMVYLEDLNDAEFMLFSDEVAASLENDYPVYVTFTQMPGMQDTIDEVVVNVAYSTTWNFFNAVLAENTDDSQIRRMEAECASDLFDWTITEIDIIEPAN